MNKTTTREQEVKNAVLHIMERWHNREKGYWFGHPDLIDEVNEVLETKAPALEITGALRTLRKEGLVYTTGIFDEDTGKLKGSGYFISDSGRAVVKSADFPTFKHSLL